MLWSYVGRIQHENDNWLPCTVVYEPRCRKVIVTFREINTPDLDVILEDEDFNAMYLVPGASFSISNLTVVLEDPSCSDKGTHHAAKPIGLSRKNQTFGRNLKLHKTSTINLEISETSQETNPAIHKYHIMYTTDKTKKAKTWHDGHAEFSPKQSEWTFYDRDCKTIHRRKISATLGPVVESLLIECARYTIEIGAPMKNPVTIAINEELCEEPIFINSTLEPDLDATTLPASKLDLKHIEKLPFLYTTQKTQKAKKWKDGILFWDPNTNVAIFNDEDGRPMHR